MKRMTAFAGLILLGILSAFIRPTLCAEPAPAATTPPPANAILCEFWDNIEAKTIAGLTTNPNYPDKPNDFEFLTAFETHGDRDDYFGTRVRGYLIAPETGNYTFWIAADDKGELWLSTSEDPAQKMKIAEVPDWTESQQWKKHPKQKSAPIALEKGKKYYVEALQVDTINDDHLAVGWELPSGAKELPIPGSRLEACPAPTRQPKVNQPVTLTVTTPPPTSPGSHVIKGQATFLGKTFPVAFQIFLQKEYFASKEKFPIITSMHNVIEALGGSDGNGVQAEGFGLLTSKDIGADTRHTGEWPPVKFNPRKEAQFIGLLPQCPKDKSFQFKPMSAVIIEEINWIEKNYRADGDRCYLTGFSYGGTSTWEVALQFPERFAAVVPLSGRAARKAEKAPEILKNVGVWCGVGEKDGDFMSACSKMNEIFVAAKHPNFHFTIIKGGEHHCYQSIYGNPEFWKWLLAQRRKPAENTSKY